MTELQDKAAIVTMSKEDNADGVRLEWSHVEYDIPIAGGFMSKDPPQIRTLLRGVSGSVGPGQMIAIMGSSGAGKSTLLNVLAGRIGMGEIRGSILANGNYRQRQTWRKTVAFVEQDDMMLSNLTVRETLTYAAMFRLPGSMSKSDKFARVDQIIQQLGLHKCVNTRIGDKDGARGISGGERKRVSIGIEMVSDPKLLFLDEPTSGLDAFTAVSILETVKKIAVDRRKSILCTIHQPRTEILELFDSIILLSDGKVVFSGGVKEAIDYFTQMGLPCPPLTNPSDFWLDTITPDFRSEEQRAASLKTIQLLHDKWDERIKSEPMPTKLIKDAPIPKCRQEVASWPNSAPYELFMLLKRDLNQQIFRSRPNVIATIVQAVVTTIIFSGLFWQVDNTRSGISNRLGFLFIITVNNSFSVIMPIIGTLPLVKALIRRERSADTYRVWTAFISRILVGLIQPLVVVLFQSLIVYHTVGLVTGGSHLGVFVFAMLLHVATMSFIGTMIGAAVPTAFIGQTLAPLFMMVQLLFGGMLVNTGSLPGALSWIRFFSTMRFTFMNLATNEFTGHKFDCKGPGCFPDGESVLSSFDLNEFATWKCFVANACSACIYLIIGVIMFARRTQPNLKLR